MNQILNMKHFRTALLITCIAASLAAACTAEPDNRPRENSGAVSQKIINNPTNAIEGSLVIRLKDGEDISAVSAAIKSVGATAERLFNPIPGKEEQERKHGLDRWFQIRFDGLDVQTAAEAFACEDAVRSIEYDKAIVKASDEKVVPLFSAQVNAEAASPVSYNDPLFKKQWYLYNNGSKADYGKQAVAGADVNVRDAWRVATGDPSIIVAVLDDGVKYTHPDLAANMWVNKGEIPGNGIDDDGNGYIDDVHGLNFTLNNGKGGPIDWKSGDSGHGTHVAGIVGAVNNNGVGISSIAGGTGNGDGIRIMGCQILSGYSSNGAQSYANAIRYAADNGASVLQCSWGEPTGQFLSDAQYARGQTVVLAALEYFLDPGDSKKYNSGVITDGNIIVFSAGNDWSPTPAYPGAYHKFVCVSSVGQDNLPSWFTNYGPGVNIAAPGGDSKLGITILSTLPSEAKSAAGQDYGYIEGTSQATPQVSSTVALGLSYAKKLGKKFTRDEFISMLLTSVDDLDNRLTGTKTAGDRTMNLDNYKGKMGTGCLDVWKFMMSIEGTPFTTVKSGEDASIDLTPYFGGNAANLTWLGVDIPAAEKEALGISKDPEFKDGKLLIRCDKMGAGKITISAIAGGSNLGGEEAGGMQISKTISVVSRGVASSNGGWL